MTPLSNRIMSPGRRDGLHMFVSHPCDRRAFDELMGKPPDQGTQPTQSITHADAKTTRAGTSSNMGMQSLDAFFLPNAT